MNTKEKAAAIRKQIKTELGYTSRQVSVRCRPCTYSMSIDVTVKVLVPLARIKEIVGQYERIARCEASGEILSGGNLFTSVEYDRDIIEAAAKPVADAMNAAHAAGEQFSLAGFVLIVNGPHDLNLADVGDDGCGSVVARCWNVEAAAERLTRELVLAGKVDAISTLGVTEFVEALPTEDTDTHTAFCAALGL